MAWTSQIQLLEAKKAHHLISQKPSLPSQQEPFAHSQNGIETRKRSQDTARGLRSTPSTTFAIITIITTETATITVAVTVAVTTTAVAVMTLGFFTLLARGSPPLGFLVANFFGAVVGAVLVPLELLPVVLPRADLFRVLLLLLQLALLSLSAQLLVTANQLSSLLAHTFHFHIPAANVIIPVLFDLHVRILHQLFPGSPSLLTMPSDATPAPVMMPSDTTPALVTQPDDTTLAPITQPDDATLALVTQPDDETLTLLSQLDDEILTFLAGLDEATLALVTQLDVTTLDLVTQLDGTTLAPVTQPDAPTLAPVTGLDDATLDLLTQLDDPTLPPVTGLDGTTLAPVTQPDGTTLAPVSQPAGTPPPPVSQPDGPPPATDSPPRTKERERPSDEQTHLTYWKCCACEQPGIFGHRVKTCVQDSCRHEQCKRCTFYNSYDDEGFKDKKSHIPPFKHATISPSTYQGWGVFIPWA
ncbi:hypothetical protein J3F84DRAFT_353061 [Trichoderma pleuroticola]